MTSVKLNLLVIKTRQLDRLKEFYAALGIDFTQERHGAGPLHYAGRVGAIVLEVFPLPGDGGDGGAADTTTRLGFAVPDVDAAVRALGAAGATVVAPPRGTEWGYRAVVRDPDGRAVELCRDAGPPSGDRSA